VNAGDRREQLLAAATEHVLEHGLIGLTLRPLAAAIGTSDRMLVYHFGTRDHLVSEIVSATSDRGVEAVHALTPAAGVRAAVNALWAAYQDAPLSACLDVYCQAATEGLLGREPYLSDARTANERWTAALRDYLTRSGTPVDRVGRVVTLVDSALYGFHLDLTTDRPHELAQGVDDLARGAALLADPSADD
jgi:AcrR family transcriptional regulator